MGAGHQFGGAFRAEIARMGLCDRLEKTDFQARAFKGANQAKADGGQTHAKIRGGDEKSLHTGFSIEQCNGRGEMNNPSIRKKSGSRLARLLGAKTIVI